MSVRLFYHSLPFDINEDKRRLLVHYDPLLLFFSLRSGSSLASAHFSALLLKIPISVSSHVRLDLGGLTVGSNTMPQLSHSSRGSFHPRVKMIASLSAIAASRSIPSTDATA